MTPCPGIDQWHRGVPRRLRWPTVIGVAILVVWVGGFGVWAAIAPLDGAVVVSGSFVATGQNKHVQHLEGGILREVLVHEGDLVEAGQPLLRLDATAGQRQVAPPRAEQVPPAHHEGAARGRDRRSDLRLPETCRPRQRTRGIAAIFERQKIELRARRAKQ